jgi:hypothetical protein
LLRTSEALIAEKPKKENSIPATVAIKTRINVITFRSLVIPEPADAAGSAPCFRVPLLDNQREGRQNKAQARLAVVDGDENPVRSRKSGDGAPLRQFETRILGCYLGGPWLSADEQSWPDGE